MDSTNHGTFVNNIVHFGRILRAAGLPVGTGRILDAVRAVELVGVADKDDFYWTLHSVFVSHPRHRYLFEQAFQVFWRNPRILERSISALLPEIRVPESEKSTKDIARRLAESLYPQQVSDDLLEELEPEFEFRASMTYSDRERLQSVDFDTMSTAEMQQAKQAVADLGVAFREIPTRRFRATELGEKLDMRNSLRASLKGSADVITLIRKKRRMEPPPVVLICDISGSMSEYSRMILHFAHTLMFNRKQVFCFVFGTRLTNVTRQLRVRDVDCALADVSESVEDWYGGTRIGECLKLFNQTWVRRLPLHKATILLVTDGLDRSESVALTPQIQMLHRSCKELIWLNPLLRYTEFEPRVSGIRAMLPHVDAFLPVHNLNSLQSLAEMLSRRSSANNLELNKQRFFWRRKLHDSTPFIPQTSVS